MATIEYEEYTVHLSIAQAEAIERIKPRWTRVGDPQPTIGCNGAVVVQCFYSEGGSMWIIIETDGYTHS